MPRPKIDPALKPFHPIVRRWFADRLGAPSVPQRAGWPAIARGEHTLILAPTGTGKTLAAFLWEVNALLAEAERGPLANAVHILYVSPLKALGNDVQRNLESPLAELRAAWEAAGKEPPEVRVAVRTGDTPARDRARMVRRSPHILITTPESLHILLTSERARTMLTHVRAVIVDEIHALAGGKRGAHLALSLERLERLTTRPPQRIGLSATQRPLEEIARFLGGNAGARARDEGEPQGEGEGGGRDGEGPPRSAGHTTPVASSPASLALTVDSPSSPALPFRAVTIVDCGSVKRTELRIESPTQYYESDAGSIWPAVAALALKHIRSARTTLVFVNNRANAERMAARINKLAGEELALPYHGSLARERRLALEESLKAGGLRALVTTSSLELGIDVGSVDVVLQLQSPKRVSAGLQRVGRAGHTVAAVSRGVFVPTHREDAMETAALVAAMRDGEVEPTRVVQNALDVLAQVIVAMTSVDDWTDDDLFALVRCAYPYHRLSRAAYDEVLAMLSGKYPSDLAAALQPRLTWDRVSGVLRAPRASRMAAVTGGGTIPDRGLYGVYLGEKTRLGELDEEFVHEARVGEAFQLGSSTWRITRIEHDRVTVVPAPGAPAKMPFWHGEFLARDAGVAPRVGALRRTLDAARTRADLQAIATEYACDEATAEQLAEHVAQQRAATGVVPDERVLVIEDYRDESGAVRVVLHSPFGGRVHAPWGMALAQRLREALGETANVQVQTGDDGILFHLPDLGRAPPVGALLDLTPEEADRRILDEIGGTSLFGARFRMAASRALLFTRGAPGKRVPLWLQRLRGLDLLEAVRQFPSFPLLVETYRELLQDAFDNAGLHRVLTALARGEIRVRTAHTEVASPFAHGLEFGFLIDQMYGDDTPRAGQRAEASSLDRGLLDDVLGVEARDDGTREALARVIAERQGRVHGRRARTADELAMVLDRAGDLTVAELAERTAPPAEGGRGDQLERLLEDGRVIALRVPGAAAGAMAGAAAGAPRGAPPRHHDTSAAADDPHQSTAWRIIPTEQWPRWAAAYGEEAVATVRAGVALLPRAASDVVPAVLRREMPSAGTARREILARHVADSGPFTLAELVARYGLDPSATEAHVTQWQRMGRLVRGVFRDDVAEPEWCSRRLVESARRRALDVLRRSVHAVPLVAFQHFLQRWQRLDPRDRVAGPGGTTDVVRQLAGLARPAPAWERDYLPARVDGYEHAWLAGTSASGEFAWVGAPPLATGDVVTNSAPSLARLRFVARGTGRLWLGDAPALTDLSSSARRVHEALVAQGASFTGELEAATGLTPLSLKEGLRELAAHGLVTNDTVESLRELLRTPPMPTRDVAAAPDHDRWLPASFTPSPGRPVVQRRPNLRRLPKWRRPDADGIAPAARPSGWTGRWSLVRVPGVMGPERTDEEAGDLVARQWLARYGVVTRDWWRRERPAVGWRAIYRELRRLEMRGEVRRGYFVEGLAGAQFALPEVVDRLREAAAEAETPEAAPVVVMAASDPANVHALPLEEGAVRDPLARPRGAGALLVVRAGRVVLSAESRGRRVTVAEHASAEAVEAAAAALALRLGVGTAGARRRDVEIDTIDGIPAATSAHAPAFTRAGFRRGAQGLRWFATTF